MPVVVADQRAVAYSPLSFLREQESALAHHVSSALDQDLAEGRLAEAVELLSTDMLPLNVSARHAYQLAMHGLAQAHEGLDQRDAAIEALESARSQGPLTIFEPGATWFWLHNLHYLHRLHLEAGRSIAAAEVAAELHSALRVADPGHPFLQGLTE